MSIFENGNTRSASITGEVGKDGADSITAGIQFIARNIPYYMFADMQRYGGRVVLLGMLIVSLSNLGIFSSEGDPLQNS